MNQKNIIFTGKVIKVDKYGRLFMKGDVDVVRAMNRYFIRKFKTTKGPIIGNDLIRAKFIKEPIVTLGESMDIKPGNLKSFIGTTLKVVLKPKRYSMFVKNIRVNGWYLHILSATVI